MMEIYALLKLIGQAIKSIKASLSAKVNNYYYTSASVAATKSASFTVCSLTIPKTGIYLVIGGIDSNVNGGDSTVLLANTSYPDTAKASSLVGKNGRSTMNAGGGVHTWSLAEVKTANAKINLTSYGYYTSAWTARGSLLAIRLV